MPIFGSLSKYFWHILLLTIMLSFAMHLHFKRKRPPATSAFFSGSANFAIAYSIEIKIKSPHMQFTEGERLPESWAVSARAHLVLPHLPYPPLPLPLSGRDPMDLCDAPHRWYQTPPHTTCHHTTTHQRYHTTHATLHHHHTSVIPDITTTHRWIFTTPHTGDTRCHHTPHARWPHHTTTHRWIFTTAHTGDTTNLFCLVSKFSVFKWSFRHRWIIGEYAGCFF